MALTTTTLNGAVLVDANTITVTSATGFAANMYVLVDQEVMQVSKSYVSGTAIPVQRGLEGTRTQAHVTTANVTVYLGSDTTTPAIQAATSFLAAGRPRVLQSITATGTLTLPPVGTDLTVILNGTSVITLTVPVPTKDMDGTNLVILGNGAAAHVPTFTSGLNGAGSSYDAYTNNATGLLCISVYASNGLWCVPAAPAWTGTVTNITGGIA